jgi:hypothetical protein
MYSASSCLPSIPKAVEQIRQQLSPQVTAQAGGLLLFFSSTRYNLHDLGTELNQAFSQTCVVGCTSAGELSPLGYSQNSVTCVYFPYANSRCACALIKSMDTFSLAESQALIDDLMHQLEEQAIAPVPSNTLALTLLDGLSIHEEQVLQVINASLGQIPLLGGSAGDDLHFEHTEVYYQGDVHQNAAVLVLINTRHPFTTFSYHHLQAKQEKLVVTRADVNQRRVYELNGFPAVEEYARLCGSEVADLDALQFALHPLTIKMGDRYYARSVQQVHDDGSLSFYSAIEIGVVLTDAEPSHIVSTTQQWLAKLELDTGPAQLVLTFDCILRFLEVNHKQLQSAMLPLLQNYHMAGFSTYGEQQGGSHLNHTFTGVYFGVLDD